MLITKCINIFIIIVRLDKELVTGVGVKSEIILQYLFKNVLEVYVLQTTSQSIDIYGLHF